MANRFFQQFQGCLEHSVVKLYGVLTVGAAGAVTTGTGNGITSFTKESGDGTYTILLDDAYNSLLSLNAIHLVAAAEDLVCQITSDTVSTASAPSIEVAFTAGGALANPASGTVALFEITLRNSSLTK